MAKFIPTPAELAALERIFDLAEGYGGGAMRARSLLCAWWNATELGGFDFTDLWNLDDANLAAALTVISMIARAPQGTYADAIPAFEKRMRALAVSRADALKQKSSESG